jgi:hypothetical protein
MESRIRISPAIGQREFSVGVGADRFQLPSLLAGIGSAADLQGHFVLGRSLPCEPDGWV